MKKNLITVIILALVLVNLVLTITLTLSIVPEAKKANELISKVCSAIDLDLQAGDTAGSLKVSIDQTANYDISQMTITLRDSGDGKTHYAVVSVVITLDTTNPDFAKFAPDGGLSGYEAVIKTEINKVVASHTLEELQAGTQKIQGEILEDLQQLFASDFIISVGFSGVTYQ